MSAESTASSASSADEQDAIRVHGVQKRFGATWAIRDASLEVRRGEIHAILGENGSGKSTLVKLLAGYQPPDGGVIEIVPGSADARRNFAAHRSAALIFQEVLIATGMSVLDNVWLGTDRLLRSRVPWAKKIEEADRILTLLCGREIDLYEPAGALALSDQQAVCIARALVRRPDVLLMDESTSALDLDTRDRLFGILRGLRESGVSVVFISHRMDEILQLADRTTVMRAGRTVATIDRADSTPHLLVSLMTDRTEDTRDRREQSTEPLRTVLRCTDLRLRAGSAPVQLEVRAGEIIGVAGLEGHGQQDLLLALAGFGQAEGTIAAQRAAGPDALVTTPHQASALGIAYVPRDRRKASIFVGRSIADNFAIATLRHDVRAGVYRNSSARERLEQYSRQLRIRKGSPDAPIGTLSGGNQQKVVLARWLATRPAVLLLNDPTRGVDLGAKRDIHRLLRDLADGGTAIVLVSSEVDEILRLADRCLVMREGTVSVELDRSELDEDRLVAAFFGEEVAS